MPIGPAPIATVSRPISRERRAGGAARNMIVLCITEKPAMPTPESRISANDSGGQAESANARTASRNSSEEPV